MPHAAFTPRWWRTNRFVFALRICFVLSGSCPRLVKRAFTWTESRCVQRPSGAEFRVPEPVLGSILAAGAGQLQGDVDELVLLPADQAPSTRFLQDVPCLHPVTLRLSFRMPEEA